MITAGHYTTKGGHHVRVVRDFTHQGGLGIIPDIGYVAYNANGEFAYKDCDYTPQDNPGETFDLIVEREQQR